MKKAVLRIIDRVSRPEISSQFQETMSTPIYQLCSIKLIDFNRIYLNIKRKSLSVLPYIRLFNESTGIFGNLPRTLLTSKKNESFSSDFIGKALLKNLTSKKPSKAVCLKICRN